MTTYPDNWKELNNNQKIKWLDQQEALDYLDKVTCLAKRQRTMVKVTKELSRGMGNEDIIPNLEQQEIHKTAFALAAPENPTLEAYNPELTKEIKGLMKQKQRKNKRQRKWKLKTQTNTNKNILLL